jgi:hypothetical protein
MGMLPRIRGARTLTAVAGMAVVLAGAAACGTTAGQSGGPAEPTHSTSAPATTPATTPGGTGSSSAPAVADGPTTSGQSQVAGIWPVRTRAQAIDLQQSVDTGHQPWLLDPEQVAVAWARSELHVSQPNVQRISATRYAVRVVADTETILTLAQPVRAGRGGIWVVTSATAHRL